MKKIILLICLLPFFALADAKEDIKKNNHLQPIELETVKLALTLRVHEVCTEPRCFELIVSPGVSSIRLMPEWDDCISTGNNNCVSYLYTGSWSNVQTRNGVRYIGIVTVTKNVIAFGEENEPIEFRYSIKVEILGDDGVEARGYYDSLESLDELSAITLMTTEKEVHGSKYYATLFVGDEADGLRGDFPCTDCTPDSPTPFSIPNFNVELGTVL